jgi:IclR family pca regulon transcriptional regulator
MKDPMPDRLPEDSNQPDALAATPALRRSVQGGLRADAFLQALEKGMAALETFTARTPRLSIAEVAERTGQDRATARRALLTLTQMGYLTHEHKRFALTAKVLGFGYQYLAALPFWAQAHPVLEELSDELNETISIGVLDGDDVVFILRVPAKRLLTFDPSTGQRVPAQVHSIGHVLMSTWSDTALAAHLNQLVLQRFTSQTLADKETLRQAIVAVRSQGWAMVGSQHEDNLGGISVPLLDARGNAIAALNVNFIIDSEAQQRAVGVMLPRLRLAARRIQQSMPRL